MKSIPIEELAVGTQFTQPVYVDGENLFVPEFVAVKERDIDRLEKWGVSFVLTEGSVVTEVDEPQASESEDGGAAVESADVYSRATASFDHTFDAIRKNQQPDRSAIDASIEQLVDATTRHIDDMLNHVLLSERSEPTHGRSGVDCCILSVALGIGLSLVPDQLRNLGFGASLHDVGMLRVPSAILDKKTDLNVDEVKQVRTHTLHSYRIVQKDLGYEDDIATIVLQHHERWDGKGYPRQLSRDQISLEARIVAVCDAFEAMVKERPYRNSMIGYTAMRQLLNDNSRRFDSEILKVFIKTIGIYPVGSFVLLNNGGIGRVIKINRGSPLRPLVRMLIDQTGQKFLQGDGPSVDLGTEKDVFIAKAIDPNNALAAKKQS